MPKITDPYEELTAMFLTGKEGNGRDTKAAFVAPTPPVAAPQLSLRLPPIELLIVGHLPVRGNLWLTPYADAMARENGSTALIRLDGFEPSVQLLRSHESVATTASSDSMSVAIEEVSEHVDQWIVRVPSNMNGLDLARASQHADQITILTGADEAAVVATYQIIKDLAGHDDVPHVPPIGLAIVGCAPAAASAIVERLNRTIGSFLNMEIQLTMCLPRMDAAVKSTKYLSFGGQNAPLLNDVLTCVDRVRRLPRTASQDTHDVAGRLYPNGSNGTPKPPFHTNAVAPTPLRETPSPTSAEMHSAPPRRPAIKLAPKPAMAVEAKHPSRVAEPDAAGQPRLLSSFISGLTPLPVRAPGHERIEIAVDGDGCLHLLGHEHALREMPVVAKWTIDHRELLVMACAAHPINSLSQAKCHIFSDRPITVSDLHSSDYALHVLAPVQVKGETAWYCAPLK